VDLICFPSGKFIVRGDVAGRLLSTSAPFIIKMEVAPVLAIAWLVAIVSALRYCGMGCPYNAQAVNAINWRTRCVACQWRKLFDIITISSSSSMDDVLMLMGVGFEAGSKAEIKWLHLCAMT
jgi:hypothetical protein